jgi:hypothetical protein
VTAAAAAAVVIGLLAWLLPRAFDDSGAGTATGNGTSGGSGASSGSRGTSSGSGQSDARNGNGPGPGPGPSTSDPGPSDAGGSGSAGQSGPSPAVDRTAGVVGVWRGAYRCTQGLTSLDLTINRAGGTALRAVFAFSAHPDNPTVPSGSFTMVGSYEDGHMVLRGDQWIVQPPGYLTVDLEATITEARPSVINGSVIAEGSACSTFAVGRQG